MLRTRSALLAALALLLFGSGLVLASCGGDDGEATPTVAPTTTGETEMENTGTETTETTTEKKPVVVNVVVEGGVPKGGIVRQTVDEGDRVVLVVTSDVADEVHVHGYDVSRDVASGSTARIAFVAKLPGRFEVELEERGVQIADLTVNP